MVLPCFTLTFLGSLRAQVRQLREENSELRSRLAQQEARVQELEARLQRQAAPEAPGEALAEAPRIRVDLRQGVDGMRKIMHANSFIQGLQRQ